MTSSDEDLKDVLRGERSRGRKQPGRASAEHTRKEKEKAVLEAMRGPNPENALREALRTHGFSPTEIEEKIKIFRKLRGDV